MSAQLTLDFTRGEVQKLDKECREAFQRGSERTDMLVICHCWEYHRLWHLRDEARRRLLRWEIAVNGAPSNDTVPARGAEPPHR